MNAATNQPSILTLRLGQSDQAGHWYCPVSGLFTRFSSAGPYGFREPSPIPTFGLFMSMTLVGLLRSRADPDYHKLNSSLQVS